MNTTVLVKKSGISNILIMENRPASEELHRWLKDQRCRVGPVFEPAAGRFAFYVYRRQQIVSELIGKHGGFTTEVLRR